MTMKEITHYLEILGHKIPRFDKREIENDVCVTINCTACDGGPAQTCRVDEPVDSQEMKVYQLLFERELIMCDFRPVFQFRGVRDLEDEQ